MLILTKSVLLVQIELMAMVCVAMRLLLDKHLVIAVRTFPIILILKASACYYCSESKAGLACARRSLAGNFLTLYVLHFLEGRWFSFVRMSQHYGIPNASQQL